MSGYDEELTIEKLKKFKGFEEISDDEAEIIIRQLNEFCRIVYDDIRNSKKSRS